MLTDGDDALSALRDVLVDLLDDGRDAALVAVQELGLGLGNATKATLFL